MDFLNDFLLKHEESKTIYKTFSEKLPIYDYHCHLKADDIYKNRAFSNISQIWLEKDHYKWRLMRSNGIQEKYITGNATDKEKFLAWAKTIERSMGNPIYHWVHMELEQVFGIKLPLNHKNADLIWEQANEQLGENGIRARDLIHKFSVKLIATTDQPLSDLHYHQLLREENNDFEVIPTLRVDALVMLTKEFLEMMGSHFGSSPKTLRAYLEQVDKIFDYFDKNACRSVDLGLPSINFKTISTDCQATFEKIESGTEISLFEQNDLQTYLTQEIMKRVFHKDWVFQLHFGAIGSVNENAKSRLGTGTGFDTMIDQDNISSPLIYLFNTLNNQNQLPKTILYNIDGSKNNVLQTVIGCFQENEQGIRGKIQHGPAWWMQDTLRGNRAQLLDLAEQGILMNFVGMTTDSRSFLSYVRHDYFRRILCDVIGEWVHYGEIPNDSELIQEMIEDICYKNAISYFRLNGGQ